MSYLVLEGEQLKKSKHLVLTKNTLISHSRHASLAFIVHHLLLQVLWSNIFCAVPFIFSLAYASRWPLVVLSLYYIKVARPVVCCRFFCDPVADIANNPLSSRLNFFAQWFHVSSFSKLFRDDMILCSYSEDSS